MRGIIGHILSCTWDVHNGFPQRPTTTNHMWAGTYCTVHQKNHKPANHILKFCSQSQVHWNACHSYTPATSLLEAGNHPITKDPPKDLSDLPKDFANVILDDGQICRYLSHTPKKKSRKWTHPSQPLPISPPFPLLSPHIHRLSRFCFCCFLHLVCFLFVCGILVYVYCFTSHSQIGQLVDHEKISTDSN